jgi:hypothetical protein
LGEILLLGAEDVDLGLQRLDLGLKMLPLNLNLMVYSRQLILLTQYAIINLIDLLFSDISHIGLVTVSRGLKFIQL